MGHVRRGLFAFAALSCCVGGCLTFQIEGQSTGDMKRQITESQFYRDSALFYPDATVDDPLRIPSLSATQLQGLETDLRAWLDAVLRLHGAHSDALAKLFGEATTRRPKAILILTNQDLPEATTSANGEIAIDTRVVQSMLRSALLKVYEVEILLHRVRTDTKRNAKGFTLEEEKIALDAFLGQRDRLRLTPGRSALGMVMADDPADRSDPRELDWHAMSRLTRVLSDVDVRYDSQLLFLLAHEVGHLALGHFGADPVRIAVDDRVDACRERRTLELAADVYAAVLVTRATAENATADFMGLFGGATVLNGFETFLEYAYDYAGFRTPRGAQTCHNYPAPATRLAAIRRVYEGIRAAQVDAIVESIDSQ